MKEPFTITTGKYKNMLIESLKEILNLTGYDIDKLFD